MGLLDNFRKTEEERIEETLSKYNIFEGIECNVILPEIQLKTSGKSGTTKALATFALGFVGYAATSGFEQNEENREIQTIFQVVDNGVVFKNATLQSSDLRIPYEEIIEMEVYVHKRWPSFGKLILLENKPIVLKIDVNKFESDIILEHIAEIINEHATGDEHDESGWGLEQVTEGAAETRKESSSLMDELERLGNMYEKGLLTDEEFAAMKKKLIEGE